MLDAEHLGYYTIELLRRVDDRSSYYICTVQILLAKNAVLIAAAFGVWRRRGRHPFGAERSGPYRDYTCATSAQVIFYHW